MRTILVIVAASAGLTSSGLYAQGGAFRPMRGVTVVQRTTMTGQQSNTTIHTVQALRSDGATANAARLPKHSGTAGYHERVVFFKEQGLEAHISDVAKSKSTYHYPIGRIQSVNDANTRLRASECLSEVVPAIPQQHHFRITGRSEILGIPVVSISRTTPDGISITYIRAPSLDCMDLGSVQVFADGAVTKTETVNVTFGDPDPVLFNIPAEYRELGPIARTDLQFVFNRR